MPVKVILVLLHRIFHLAKPGGVESLQGVRDRVLGGGMGDEVGFRGFGACDIGIGGEEVAGEGCGVGGEELADGCEFGVNLVE